MSGAPLAAPGRRVNQAGLELIKRWEGFQPRAYLCPAGQPTIGYGHKLLPGESYPEGVSQDQAEALLRADLAQAEEAVSQLARVPLADNQFAALVSFAFNLGAGNLARSSLLRLLNAGDHAGAAAQFARWHYPGGQALPGLKARRQAEAELFRA